MISDHVAALGRDDDVVNSARARDPARDRLVVVGISYDGRTYQEGKKVGWRDGFRALYAIVKYNFFAAPAPALAGVRLAPKRPLASGPLRSAAST
jgi:hypothetical protein